MVASAPSVVCVYATAGKSNDGVVVVVGEEGGLSVRPCQLRSQPPSSSSSYNSALHDLSLPPPPPEPQQPPPPPPRIIVLPYRLSPGRRRRLTPPRIADVDSTTRSSSLFRSLDSFPPPTTTANWDTHAVQEGAGDEKPKTQASKAHTTVGREQRVSKGLWDGIV